MLWNQEHPEQLMNVLIEEKSQQNIAQIEHKRFSSRTTNLNPRSRAMQSQAGSKVVLQPNNLPVIKLRNQNESAGSTSLGRLLAANQQSHVKSAHTRNVQRRLQGVQDGHHRPMGSSQYDNHLIHQTTDPFQIQPHSLLGRSPALMSQS